MDKVKEFLSKNDYVVKISYVNGKECRAEFPINKLKGGTKRTVASYKAAKNSYTITIGDTSVNAKCPNYAIRLAIYAHIVEGCKAIGYPNSLIEFYDGEGNPRKEGESLLLFLDEPKSKEEQDKEKVLVTIVEHAYKLNFNEKFEAIAKQYNVEDGYYVVKQILGE
jgi:hypothetical protein